MDQKRRLTTASFAAQRPAKEAVGSGAEEQYLICEYVSKLQAAVNCALLPG